MTLLDRFVIILSHSYYSLDHDAPTFNIVPPTGVEGGQVTLVCQANIQGVSNPTFSWTKNGASVGSNSNTLTLNPVQVTDAGSYVCITDVADLGQKSSTAQILSVTRE